MSGWRDMAACVGCDPEIFFPPPNDKTAVRQAQAICGICPVIEQCGRFAVIALSADGAIRKCMRRVVMMCARHSACERLDRQEARG